MDHDSGSRPGDDRLARLLSVPSATRRSFLGLAACGAAALLLPGLAAASPVRPGRPRELTFHNLHTDEQVTACYWDGGAYVPEAFEGIDAILRDHRTGEICRMSPRLVDLVYVLTARLGGRTVEVVSGFRSLATHEMLRAADPDGVAANSLHLTGEAIDLRVKGRPLRRVRDAALALGAGGVGYYPRSGFVHVDVGRVRRW